MGVAVINQPLVREVVLPYLIAYASLQRTFYGIAYEVVCCVILLMLE